MFDHAMDSYAQITGIYRYYEAQGQQDQLLTLNGVTLFGGDFHWAEKPQEYDGLLPDSKVNDANDVQKLKTPLFLIVDSADDKQESPLLQKSA